MRTGSRRQWAAGAAAAVAAAGVGALVIGMADAQPSGRVSALPSSVTTATRQAPSAAATYPIAATTTPSTTALSTKPAITSTAATTSHPVTSTTAATAARPAPAVTRPPSTAKAPAQANPVHQPAAVTGQSLPLGYDTGNATQVVTVTSSSTSSTYAQISWWTKAPGGGWLRAGGPVSARVGSDGMSWNASESWSATPMGSFTLTQAFGWAGNPGTSMPYIHTDSGSWWVSENHDGLYNTYQHCYSNCPFNQGDPNEHLSAIDVYRYALVIDYNRYPAVYPKGSAFFFHIMNGSATAGCVATDVGSLTRIMGWLNPGNHPRILIGVS